VSGLVALEWSSSVLLSGCWRGQGIPEVAGLYRLRRIGRDDLDYIGQTGGSLRKRLAMLAGVYAPEMPYRDPHVAAPALWALRGSLRCEFEVSVAPLEGPGPLRKAWEAAAIALYRQEHGKSPTVSFGRGPERYRLSSHNNARIVAAGKRSRGGKCDEVLSCHTVGIPPAGPLTGDPHGSKWGGHVWESSCIGVHDATPAHSLGSTRCSSSAAFQRARHCSCPRDFDRVASTWRIRRAPRLTPRTGKCAM
jgi:hypothetical protein